MAPKSILRLSRQSLITLATRWLEKSAKHHTPYLACNRDMLEAQEEDYLYEPAKDVETLRKLYQSLKDDKTFTNRDIADRIVEGDWRRGLSLDQLAMIDLQHLEESDTCLRWNAMYVFQRSNNDDADSTHSKKRQKLAHTETLPQIQPANFLQSLKQEISPLVKAHYYLHRLPPPYNLTILRLFVTDTSGTKAKTSTKSHSADAARTLYIALPDSCPYVYIAVSGSSLGSSKPRTKGVARPDLAYMKRIILEAIPKAFSRPQERYAMDSTNLTLRSLRAICEMRGPGRGTNSNGAYSWFAESAVDSSPLETTVEPRTSESEGKNERKRKRKNEDVLSRFGPGLQHAALDRLHIKFQDLTDNATSETPSGSPGSNLNPIPISLTFEGTDVIGGFRKLAESGSEYFDMSRMPAWMTGEMGVSTWST